MTEIESREPYMDTYIQKLPPELRELIPAYRYSIVQFDVTDDVDPNFNVVELKVTLRGDIICTLEGDLNQDECVRFVQNINTDPNLSYTLELNNFNSSNNTNYIVYDNRVIRLTIRCCSIQLNKEHTKAFLYKLQLLIKKWNAVVVGDLI